MREGRMFTASEASDPDAPVAVVNEKLAAALWRGESPVGRRVGIAAQQGVDWVTIIGVMPNVGYGNVGRATEPVQLHLYLPYGRYAPRAMAVVARASGDATAVREEVRQALRRVRAGIPVFDVRTIRESRRAASADQQFVGIVMGVFAAISLLLASLGVYGVIADSVRQREREVGVRLVVGAKPGTIIWLFLNQARNIGTTGVALGLALAVGVAGVLRGHILAVRVFDPIVFLTAAATLLSVVVVAAFLPARRAAQTDPAVILRQS
jgi:hypothetical protein